MTLILSVASYRNRPPVSPLVGQFEGASVAIGRGADNDWSLPDPEVHLSKKHCVIYYLDGQYRITDISTNGVFVNGSAQPLGNGGTAVLRTGDRLLMGDYEIAVEIRAGAQAGATSVAGAPPYAGAPPRSAADPFGLADIMDPGAVRPSPFAQAPGEFTPSPQDQGAGVLGSDWLREYDPVPRAERDPNPLPQFGAHADHVPSVDAAYRPPNVSFDPPPIGTFDIPDNWQNAPDVQRAPSQAQPPLQADWHNAPPMPNPPPAPPQADWQNAPVSPHPNAPPPDWQNAPVGAGPAALPLSTEWGRGDVAPASMPRPASPPLRGPRPPSEPPLPPRDAYAPSREPLSARVPYPQPQHQDVPLPRRDVPMPQPNRDSYARPRDAPPPREAYSPPRDMPSPPHEGSWQRREAYAPADPAASAPEAPAPRSPAPSQAAPPERRSRADAGWRAFIEGAGLEEAAFNEDPVDLMRSLGRVFREMVGGLRDLLSMRDKVKTEYRVRRTVIEASNNNPLKFAIDGVEAATLLLSRPKPGYLVGGKAVNEAFNDLKAHELAFMVGMQAAVAALLQEFDPASLRKRIDAQMGWDSIIPGARQSKYWSGYEEHYRQIANAISEDARSTFGLAFAKAYEEQSKKL